MNNLKLRVEARLFSAGHVPADLTTGRPGYIVHGLPVMPTLGVLRQAVGERALAVEVRHVRGRAKAGHRPTPGLYRRALRRFQPYDLGDRLVIVGEPT